MEYAGMTYLLYGPQPNPTNDFITTFRISKNYVVKGLIAQRKDLVLHQVGSVVYRCEINFTLNVIK